MHPAGRAQPSVLIACVDCRTETRLTYGAFIVYRLSDGAWESAVTRPCCDVVDTYPVADGWEGAVRLCRQGARTVGQDATLVADLVGLEKAREFWFDLLADFWSESAQWGMLPPVEGPVPG